MCTRHGTTRCAVAQSDPIPAPCYVSTRMFWSYYPNRVQDARSFLPTPHLPYSEGRSVNRSVMILWRNMASWQTWRQTQTHYVYS